MRKSSKRKPAGRPKTYNVFNELLASPTEPLPQEYRTHQLTRMYEGLHALETADNPSTEDWRVVSDAVNMLETLVVEMQVCEDASGLLQDAIRGLAVGPDSATSAKASPSGWMAQAFRPCAPCWPATPNCWTCCQHAPCTDAIA